MPSDLRAWLLLPEHRRAAATAGVAIVTAGVLAACGSPAVSDRLKPAASAAAVAASPSPSPAAHGVPMTVFLSEDITAAQREALRPRIAAIPGARDVQHESKQQAYERFLRVFKNDRDLVKNVKPGVLPESFRFLLTDRSAAAAALKELGVTPGVYRVTGPEESPDERLGRPWAAVPSSPPLTPANKAAYLRALTRIHPQLAADPQLAVMNGQYVCSEVADMEPGQLLESTAVNFLAPIAGAYPEKAKAMAVGARILSAVRRYLCPGT